MRKKPDVQPFKEKLLLLRARLRGDVSAMADATLNRTRSEASGDLSSMPIHMADIGSDNFEQEFTLGLIENEEELLREIDGALERISEGTFGDCEECNKAIRKTRLKALPHARLCVACQRKEEESQ